PREPAMNLTFPVRSVTALAIALSIQTALGQEVPGQFIVTLKELSASRAEISAMASDIGGVKASMLSASEKVILIKVNPNDSNALKSIRTALAKSDRIVSFEPNRYIRPCVTPNDPKFVQQTHLTKVGAQAAWDKSTGNADVIVAVIDTGILVDHEDLKSNLWANPIPSPTTRPTTLPG